jgi:hypothetical protein
MGFMNALGLVKGVSDTAIDPDGKCTIEQAAVVANRSVNADQIGWYQVPLTTEERFLGFASDYFESRYYYAPTDHAPTQSLYIHSDRIWVDIPTSGGQKKSENPDMIASMKSRMIATSDPYTGQRAWVPEVNFTPIKELKDTMYESCMWDELKALKTWENNDCDMPPFPISVIFHSDYQGYDFKEFE